MLGLHIYVTIKSMTSIDDHKKSKRGRPSVDTEAVRARFPRLDLDGIDAFAASEPDRPTRQEAVRRIVRDWLVGHGYMPPDGG